MAEFRMSRTLKDKVTNVLTRRGIPFEVLEKDGELRYKVDVSGEQFHKVVLRAKMEKIQEEKNSRIPYVAKELHIILRIKTYLILYVTGSQAGHFYVNFI